MRVSPYGHIQVDGSFYSGIQLCLCAFKILPTLSNLPFLQEWSREFFF